MQTISSASAAVRRLKDVQKFIDDHQDIFKRQGVVLGCRQRHKDGYLGPYYRVAYWQHGRLRCLYLGTSAALAEHVREYLQQLQEWRSTRRQLKQLRSHARAELQRHKRECNAQLQEIGLYFQGYEARGWSNSL